MEIEKICRTCLSLSGPLLSMYDGDKLTGNGIADMLSEFTKHKPRRADNMPEKCENSDRTLRQLLPDALPDEIEDTKLHSKVAQENKSVQTLPTATATTAVQTPNVEILKNDQYVQTVPIFTTEKATSPLPNGQNDKKPTLEILKLEKVTQRQERLLEDETNMEKDYINSSSKQSRITRQNIALQSPPPLQQKPISNLKTSTENNELLFELSEQIDADDDAANLDAFAKQSSEEPEQPPTTYYAISNSRYAPESNDCNISMTSDDEIVVKKLTDDVNDDDDEVAYDLIPEKQADCNFTIYNNEKGEAEIQKREEMKCDQCVMTFVNKKNLKRHMLRRHSATIQLKKTAITLVKEQVHFKEKSKIVKKAANEFYQEQPEITEDDEVVLKYFCERCKAGFAVEKSLNYHLKQNACTVKSYKCEECSRVFITAEALNEHKASHVLANICNECDKVFESKDKLSEHMINDHKRSVRNQCNVCKKVFTMLSALRDHLRVHSGEKPFACNICNKSFSQNANLKQHIMRHSKEKKFKCDSCSNAYVTKAELFSHHRTHTGDTPFRCEFCDAFFTTSSSLVKHRRKHTGERPYACDLCPMRFSSLNVQKNHRRTHTGEKPFMCPHCSKCFTQKGDCRMHQRTHTREKNFQYYATLKSDVKTPENVNAESVENDNNSIVNMIVLDESSTEIEARTEVVSLDDDELMEIAIEEEEMC